MKTTPHDHEQTPKQAPSFSMNAPDPTVTAVRSPAPLPIPRGLWEGQLGLYLPAAVLPLPPRMTAHTLKECSYTVGELRVLCRLWCLESGSADGESRRDYAIGLEGEAGRCICPVGDRADRAFSLYERIARNTVSPCTLREVLEESDGMEEQVG